jgi:nitroreductase
MELIDVIEKRRSIRLFTDEPIPVSDLKELVRRATLAPSIANAEPWRFIAITNKELLTKLTEMVQQKYDQVLEKADDETSVKIKERIKHFSTFFNDAPAVIAVINQPYEAIIDHVLAKTGYIHDELNELRNFPNIQTLGAAIQNILLSAVDMKYGACWLTGPMLAKSEIEEELDIKHPDSLFAFVAIGKAASHPKPKDKRSFDEVFSLLD